MQRITYVVRMHLYGTGQECNVSEMHVNAWPCCKSWMQYKARPKQCLLCIRMREFQNADASQCIKMRSGSWMHSNASVLKCIRTRMQLNAAMAKCMQYRMHANAIQCIMQNALRMHSAECIVNAKIIWMQRVTNALKCSSNASKRECIHGRRRSKNAWMM